MSDFDIIRRIFVSRIGPSASVPRCGVQIAPNLIFFNGQFQSSDIPSDWEFPYLKRRIAIKRIHPRPTYTLAELEEPFDESLPEQVLVKELPPVDSRWHMLFSDGEKFIQTEGKVIKQENQYVTIETSSFEPEANPDKLNGAPIFVNSKLIGYIGSYRSGKYPIEYIVTLIAQGPIGETLQREPLLPLERNPLRPAPTTIPTEPPTQQTSQPSQGIDNRVGAIDGETDRDPTTTPSQEPDRSQESKAPSKRENEDKVIERTLARRRGINEWGVQIKPHLIFIGEQDRRPNTLRKKDVWYLPNINRELGEIQEIVDRDLYWLIVLHKPIPEDLPQQVIASETPRPKDRWRAFALDREWPVVVSGFVKGFSEDGLNIKLIVEGYEPPMEVEIFLFNSPVFIGGFLVGFIDGIHGVELSARLLTEGPLAESLRNDPLLQSNTPPLNPDPEEASTQKIVRLINDGIEGTDLLNLSNEVEALCSIIAAKNAALPLSIGLFGDWGSGKSFFMRMMREHIQKLASEAAKVEADKTAYCRNVVQLTFNAWHYIDTNLWASLTAEIFEGLAWEFSQAKKDTTKESNLLTAREKLIEAEQLRDAANLKLQQSEAKLEKIKAEEEKLLLQRDPKVIQREATRAVASALQSETLQEAAEKLNLPSIEAISTDGKERLLALEGIWGTVRALWLALKNARRSPDKVRLLVGLVGTALALTGFWLFLKDSPEKLFGQVTALAVGLFAALEPFVRNTKRALELLQQAQKASHEAIEEKRKELENKRNEEQKKHREELAEASRNVEEATREIKEIEAEIERRRADRQLMEFIKQRHESNDYTKHLGVIARAHDDFEALSKLLTEANKKVPLPPVERIVLYIDDLDRCPEDKVVDVLQAVHLLLAFPLFVVIVGVDSRWLLHSLRKHSSAFREKKLRGAKQANEELWRSTPLNYLEKIFQIPFTLRPMGKSGFGKMIESLISLKKEEAKTPDEPKIQQPLPTETTPEPKAADPTTNQGKTAENSTTKEPNQVEKTSQEPPKAEELPKAPITNTGGTIQQKETTPQTQATPNIEINPKYLEMKQEEQDFIQQLYLLIPSPRVAKRFVNLYRLILASLSEKARGSLLTKEEYKVVLLLLAILMGYPEEATAILQGLLLNQDTSGAWSEFLLKMDRTKVDPIRWNKLNKLLGDTNLGGRPCSEFQKWAQQVARYSFQSGRVLLELARPTSL